MLFHVLTGLLIALMLIFVVTTIYFDNFLERFCIYLNEHHPRYYKQQGRPMTGVIYIGLPLETRIYTAIYFIKLIFMGIRPGFPKDKKAIDMANKIRKLYLLVITPAWFFGLITMLFLGAIQR